MGLKAPTFFFLAALLVSGLLSSMGLAAPAPDFEANATDGQSFSLRDYAGQPVLLHITNIENPLCRECEEALHSQTAELARLKEEHPEVNLVTLNMRKNPYSEDGRSLSGEWWGLEIDWPWAEDFDPFPAAGKYVDLWTFKGGFSNPTLILIDRNGQVGAVRHVYKLGQGFIDGVQSSDDLYMAMQALDDPAAQESSNVAGQSTSLVGMFGLGIITSFSPCSIALMIAV
ncbi:MAG: redoxin domain-containing protein, partial [Methanosarcinales archaeon]|nr:redoxin domain-containing protein [Methanosarcinales archaeon]